jgi:hypothetical protein
MSDAIYIGETTGGTTLWTNSTNTPCDQPWHLQPNGGLHEQELVLPASAVSLVGRQPTPPGELEFAALIWNIVRVPLCSGTFWDLTTMICI